MKSTKCFSPLLTAEVNGDILARRESVLVMAKQENPARWNGRAVRNCSPVQPTALNPVRPSKRVIPTEVLVA